MIEHERAVHEDEAVKLAPEAIADDIVGSWEAAAAMTLDDEEAPHLARTILDRCAQERLQRNEQEMFDLVTAITARLGQVELHNDIALREIPEALKRLGELDLEYRSAGEL